MRNEYSEARSILEEKYLLINQAVDSVSDAIGISDAQGHHVFQNKALTDLFGYTAEELEALGGVSILIKDPEIAKEILAKSMSGKSWSGDLEMVTKSGLVFNAFKRIDPIKDGNGKIKGLIFLVTDITERKKAELQLVQANEKSEKQRKLLNEAGIIGKVGGWEFDIDTLKQTWTEETYLIHEVDFNFDPNVENGISFYTSDSRQIIENAVKKAIEFGESFDLELEIITAKNNLRHVHAIGKSDLKNRRVYGFFQDITEQKLAEKERIKLSSIVKQSTNGIAIADMKGNIIFANKAWIQMHDYETEEELIGKHLRIFHTKQQLEKEVVPFNQKVMETGFYAGEVGHIRKDGSHFPAFMSSNMINDEKGKPYAIATISRDISELKMAELALKESESKLKRLNIEKDRFISILGHDLRSPFSSLLNLSEILSENIRKPDLDEIEKVGHHINKWIQNYLDLLEDLLLWARIQDEKVTFDLQNLSLKYIYEYIHEIHKPIADTKNISINCLMAEHINVFADLFMLKTVLRNLVSNAIKFTKRGGAINIKAEENSENVIISISDNGVGMSSDQIARLFDISQVVKTKGTEKEKGTGLGLYICKEFVGKHGGKIWVESKVGTGSTFYFTIPCKVK